MMNKEFFQALDDLEREQRIPKESMIESIEAGLVSAYKKEYGFASQISVRLNEEKMTYKVYAHKLVVEEVEDEESQISLEDAQDIDKKYQLGDVVIEDITPKDFSRIAAQTAKQVILQRINDYKKNLVLDEMSQRTGEILSAIVRRKEGNTVYVEITGTQMEGVMMQQDQVPTETYNVNDVIKVYVKKIRDGAHGAQVIVSRSSAGFVRRLFEMEVPEIKAGLVKINSIVREAGFRTKLAVSSEDPNVDAVGSCIGNKGVRVNAVVAELGGEKNRRHRILRRPHRIYRTRTQPGTSAYGLHQRRREECKSYRPGRETLSCNRQKRTKRSSCRKTYGLEDRRQTLFHAQSRRRGAKGRLICQIRKTLAGVLCVTNTPTNPK